MEPTSALPVTQSVQDQCHRIVVAVMQKTGVDHVVISTGDLLLAEDKVVVVHEKLDGLHVYIKNMDDVVRVAREQDGLPT